MKYIPIAMKFGNQSGSSSFIINIILELAGLDPKLKALTVWFQNRNVPDFYEIWHSEQIELDPIFSNFYEIWR